MAFKLFLIILPDPLGTAGEVTPDSLKFVLFLGNEAKYFYFNASILVNNYYCSGSGYVYEDDGITVQYMNVAYAQTNIQYSHTPSR